ncbi:hypothetical protein [Pseudomonas sp. 2(2015)]|uniref:hypothetical protein n=1 Tax=Pseudomonas sp. 2(2015) TaxID=1619950 RepID=UPI0034D59052
MGGVRNQLNAAWTSEVVNVYRQSLSGRYPLAAGSSRDATLDDFGQFFGVGGVMDSYFRKYLQPYVDTSANPWRWQPGAAQKLGIGSGVLHTHLSAFGGDSRCVLPLGRHAADRALRAQAGGHGRLGHPVLARPRWPADQL